MIRATGSLLLLLVVSAAQAASPTHVAGYDRPQAVLTAPDVGGGTARCSYYADLTVRETGTDSPAPGAGSLRRGRGRGLRSCKAGGADVALETADFSYLGRKGIFLVFGLADPHGAVPFLIIDAGKGNVIYKDSSDSGNFRSLAASGDTLRADYRRAINAACSILADTACWASLAAKGLITAEMAGMPPPVGACAAAYAAEKAPNDDPSVIIYNVELVLDRSGRAQSASSGRIGCRPLP